MKLKSDYDREYNLRPEVVARKKAFRKTSEYKARKKVYMKEYSLRPEVKSKQKIYNQSEAGKKAKAKSVKNYRAKSKHKTSARAKARLIFKQKEICEVKGCKVIGHKHHEDYSKPLEVNWLCQVHHMNYHHSNLTLKNFLKRKNRN